MRISPFCQANLFIAVLFVTIYITLVRHAALSSACRRASGHPVGADTETLSGIVR